MTAIQDREVSLQEVALLEALTEGFTGSTPEFISCILHLNQNPACLQDGVYGKKNACTNIL